MGGMDEGSATAPGRRGRPGPSIQDVARLAGVSMQTVSRVANGSSVVRPTTRDRVLAVMREVGYSPNQAARALRRGRFNTIGLIAHQLERTGESRTIGAVVEAARREGYTVTLVNVDEPSSADVTAAATLLDNQSIDGLIIIRAEAATPDTLVLPPGLPVVVADSRLAGRHPLVAADQAGGTREAVRHLLGLGHRTVHHLAGPADSDPATARLHAWQEELARAGVDVPPVRRGDWSAGSGYAVGREMADDTSVTAVCCANDEMAVGLIRALVEHGRRVPEDVSVVGFDDIPLAPYLTPPLTSIHHDFDRLGRELVDLLVAQMRDHEPPVPRRVLVPSRLVVRRSTARPPGVSRSA